MAGQWIEMSFCVCVGGCFFLYPPLSIQPVPIPGGEQRASPSCSVPSGGVGEAGWNQNSADNWFFRLSLIESLSLLRGLWWKKGKKEWEGGRWVIPGRISEGSGFKVPLGRCEPRHPHSFDPPKPQCCQPPGGFGVSLTMFLKQDCEVPSPGNLDKMQIIIQ